jgi:hypothetical protein
MAVTASSRLTGIPISAGGIACNPVMSDGQNATSTAYMFQVGPLIFLEGNVVWTGAAAGSATFTLALPVINGVQLTFGRSQMTGGSSYLNKDAPHVGNGNWFDNGVGPKPCVLQPVTSSTFKFSINSDLTANLFASGDGLKYTVIAVIEQWL